MDTDTLFSVSGPLALVGWVALALSPLAPRVADRVAGVVVPGLLSVAYAGLVLAFWSRAEGGFDSLEGVMRLFDQPEIAMAGWLHFLAFDLFVGAWIVRTARAEGIRFALALACLPPTFLFRPAGFLLFLVVRAGHGAVRAARSSARP